MTTDSVTRAAACLTLCVLMLAGQCSAAELTDRWIYLQTNLQGDKNVGVAKAGYTGVLLADLKMAKLGDVIARYHQNLARVKRIAAETKLEVIPALFHTGYSEAMLWHDPNLAEALPVKDALFVVQGGVARVKSDSPADLRGGAFANLKLWSWKDDNLVPDNGALRVTDAKGVNAASRRSSS